MWLLFDLSMNLLFLSKKKGIYIHTYCLLSVISAVQINFCQIAFQPPAPNFFRRNLSLYWCWVFVGGGLGQVKPFFSFSTWFLLNWFQIFVPTDVEYLLVMILVRCSPLFFCNMIFLELVSSICANWCRVFVGRGLGQVQAALVLLPPTSLPRPARRRPPPHLLRHQFFSQSFFLQIFTFSPASSITQKNKCCSNTLVVREGALCPRVYYVQKLRAISDVPLVILLARVQI